MKKTLYIIGLFLCLWLGFFVGKRNNNPTQETTTKTIVRTDTITKVDTLYKEIVKPHYIREEIVRVDTIKADTAIEIKQRKYLTIINEDSITGEIRAVVSGFNPSLDTLQYNLHIPTRTITNTMEIQTTKYKQKHWNFTVGIGAGYGLINRKADVFVGGIIGYSF